MRGTQAGFALYRNFILLNEQASTKMVVLNNEHTSSLAYPVQAKPEARVMEVDGR